MLLIIQKELEKDAKKLKSKSTPRPKVKRDPKI